MWVKVEGGFQTVPEGIEMVPEGGVKQRPGARLYGVAPGEEVC